ncbi:hypothetical protein [Sinorhizobium fredii]|uniref:hypothetical protein n=1 Tax=Rhizobium fredii TaxID=380 RepID=UPI00131A0436|nr:hypothetical protein [Sinorhizobium fredii]
MAARKAQDREVFSPLRKSATDSWEPKCMAARWDTAAEPMSVAFRRRFVSPTRLMFLSGMATTSPQSSLARTEGGVFDGGKKGAGREVFSPKSATDSWEPKCMAARWDTAAEPMSVAFWRRFFSPTRLMFLFRVPVGGIAASIGIHGVDGGAPEPRKCGCPARKINAAMTVALASLVPRIWSYQG